MSPEAKRRKVEEQDRLSAFLEWCDRSGVQFSPKVYVSPTEAVAQYGMMAAEELQAGEIVFSIARSALLSQRSARIHRLLEEEGDSLQSSSGWVPLLIALLYEATAPDSPWAPYFNLWPQLEPPDLPMFWSEEERAELLCGTGVAEAVRKDLANIEREYESIVLPFIQRHPEVLSSDTHTLQLYKRLVAFVMAYSFQEPVEDDEEEEDSGTEAPPPMMVPVADLLNHVAQHNAQLEFMPDRLRMVTTRPVPAGSEIFNTYGQMGGWQLLHMYGFCEPYPGNTNETADIRMATLRDAALKGVESEEERAQLLERWAFLQRMEVAGEDAAFVFGCEEVLTNDELRTCLKVLCMSREEFAEFRENDGWEEDEDGEDELTYEEIQRLPLPWRSLLHRSAKLALAAYSSDLASDQQLLDDPAQFSKLSSRGRYALHVRYGQKRILQRLCELSAS
ncbi:N-lysine methyltransferase SETD6 [Gastrophryne carolinensis]